MIDFSAFPHYKRHVEVWQIGVASMVVIAVIFLGAGLTSLWIGEDAAMDIVKVVVLIIIPITVVVLAALVIWFFRSVLLPRIKRGVLGETSRYVPVGDIVSLLHQFAADNGFEMKEYYPDTLAPTDSYPTEWHRGDTQGDDTYILYEIRGSHRGTNFRYYCLAFTDRVRIKRIDRRSFAYASTSSGRRLEFMTILSADRPLRPWYKGQVQAVNSPNGYVFCHGQVGNRETLQKMFQCLETTA